jgi:hypothetical protein
MLPCGNARAAASGSASRASSVISTSAGSAEPLRAFNAAAALASFARASLSVANDRIR